MSCPLTSIGTAKRVRLRTISPPGRAALFIGFDKLIDMVGTPFVRNGEHSRLPAIDPGDLVYLKTNASFGARLKCLVTEVAAPQITLEVRTVFDLRSDTEVTAGDQAQLKGKRLVTTVPYVHRVIKRTG